MGGSMAAYALVEAGLRVLMIERGPPIRRGRENWAPDAALELSPYYSMESHYLVRGDDPGRTGTYQCVGGPSVFYGGVALRLRETDFDGCAEIVGESSARWPYGYRDVEPHYGRAERILGVAGRQGCDPTEPWREEPYPHTAPDLQGPARMIWNSAARLGLRPSYLPLAIAFEEPDHGSACVRCGTCDGYACGVSAKREPSTAIIPALVDRGLTLISHTVVVRLLWRGNRVTGVVGVDRRTGRRRVFRGGHYFLAAGALGSPHLILASGLEAAASAPRWVGRCLMRHCNGITFGLFLDVQDGSRAFHKQVGLLDFYGGSDGAPKLGSIQSIHPPPAGLIRDKLPGLLGGIVDPALDRATGLIVIAEDSPRRENRIEISRSRSDRYGIPRAIVTHRYTRRDLLARRTLTLVARAILRDAGAWIMKGFRLTTFSHAVGTLRMGTDPKTSPLDSDSRYRGIGNLSVTDGSFMPRSGAVNPSLTIAANALKAADHVVGRAPRVARLTERSHDRLPEAVGVED